MSKILILNECNSDNIGDQAISDGMFSVFSDMGFGVIKKDFSCNPSKSERLVKVRVNEDIRPSFFAHIKRIVPRELHSIIWLIRSYKKMREVVKGDFSYAIIGGGQLVLSNINFPIALYFWAYLLKKKGINYSIVACGAGESFRWHEKYLIRYALGHAMNKVYMRDQRSIDNVKKHFGINAFICPDAAYYLHKKYHENSLGIKNKKRVSVICITDYSIFLQFAHEMKRPILAESDYIHEWVNITTNHVKQGYQICLMATTMADIQQTIALKRALEKAGYYDIETRMHVDGWHEFIEYVGQVDLLTSGRMHALILAQIAGTKINPYLISKKIVEFSENYSRVSPELNYKIFSKIIKKLSFEQNLSIQSTQL